MAFISVAWCWSASFGNLCWKSVSGITPNIQTKQNRLPGNTKSVTEKDWMGNISNWLEDILEKGVWRVYWLVSWSELCSQNWEHP